MPSVSSTTAERPAPAGSDTETIGVAIIGAGERGVYYVGSRMAELARETGFRVVCVQDRLEDRATLAARHLDGIYADAGLDHRVRVAPDLEAAVRDPAVDLPACAGGLQADGLKRVLYGGFQGLGEQVLVEGLLGGEGPRGGPSYEGGRVPESFSDLAPFE